MYNNILIITDNLWMANQFEIIIKGLNYSSINWTYSISPFSNKLNFEKSLEQNIKIFDLKKSTAINEITSNFDLVISIHSKQIFPEKMVSQVKCINVHPGYNPINRGWYPQVFAIIKNLPIGATIHEIDNQLDHGDIIARSLVDKNSFDTSETLYNKVVKKEVELLKENIVKIINDNYQTIKPENEGELFLKTDFNKLCKLDLDEVISTRDFINKLRALTHGEFNNAYFIDEETGKKIFIKIELKNEK